MLIANEREDRLALVAPLVANLGHEVIAREIDVKDVAVTARERPEVARFGLGKSSEHALALIDKIVKEAACPVILLLHTPDPPFVRRPRSAEPSPTSPTPTSPIWLGQNLSVCARVIERLCGNSHVRNDAGE